MTAPRPARDSQGGNSLLLALIVMSSLATLGSLTVVSVQSSLKASTSDRSQTVAMYAAESGGAAAMEFLRQPGRFSITEGWSAFVLPNGQLKRLSNTTELLSNGALPGDPKNLFSPDLNASFVVELSNNRSDPGYADSGVNDHDGIVIIRSTGNGPQGSVAIIEWEVQRFAPQPIPPIPIPPPPIADPIQSPPLPATWVTPDPAKGLHIRSWRIVL